MAEQRLSLSVGPSYGSSPQNETSSQSRGWIFPLEPFWILDYATPSLYQLVPHHLRVIQSFPHLVLLVGTATNVVLITRTAEDYRHWRNRKTPYLAVLAASGCFSLYCLWQLAREMAQYRHDFQQRSAQIQNLKDEMTRRFHLLTTELEDLLARSTETEAGLAERSLDSERRDFYRFLKAIGPKLAGQPGSDDLLEHFRRFLSIWLQILAECSPDPVGQPYSVMGEVEFYSFLSAPDLADRLGDHVKAKEIRFVRDRVEASKKGVLSLKSAWASMTKAQRHALKWTGLGRFVKTRPDEEQGDSPKAKAASLPAASIESFWFRFELGAGCGLEVSEDDSYPIRMKCVLFTLILLSHEHLSFILSFFVGCGLLLLNTFISDPSQVIIASIAVTLCCIVFVLYDFLDIDTTQRLEQHIMEMQAATKQIEERRQNLQAFFSKMQLLFALWQMRTLPRLGLMKQFGMAVEDEDPSSRANLLLEPSCGRWSGVV